MLDQAVDDAWRRPLQAGAVLLLIVLVCVPAVTRATQRLDGAPVTPTAGFSKSGDCPPNRVTLDPVAPSFVLAAAVAAVRAPHAARAIEATDSRLIPSPVPAPPGPLRAPPVSFLA